MFITGIGERLLGYPSWVREEKYDIVAKVVPEDIAAWKSQGPEKKMLQELLQTALADRCKLKAHTTTVEVSAFALIPGKRQPKIKASQTGAPLPPETVRLAGGINIIPYKRGEFPQVTLLQTSMEAFAAYLSNGARLPVVDQTGLKGEYDFEVSQREPGPDGQPDPMAPTVWDVEAMGFRLKPVKVSMEAVVIDHIERPSEN